MAGPDISQIYLTDAADKTLPAFLAAAVTSVKSNFPGSRHTLYLNHELRRFIVDHFEAPVVQAYDSLVPYSYRADLGRYCLLFVKGGWYFDIAVQVITGIPVDDGVEFLAFRDRQLHSGTSWACSNAVLYSRPGNPVLKSAIDRVVRNCQEQYYGITPLCPTGPTVLGEALAENRANSRHVLGDSLELTPTRPKRNLAFVLPDGTLMAWGKPAEGGDLASLGAKGVHNYNDFWHARKVYTAPAESLNGKLKSGTP